MNLSELEPIRDTAKSTFDFPDYTINLAESSRFGKNQVAIPDYSGRKILVKDDSNLLPIYVLDGIIWCYVKADYARGRESDEPYLLNLRTSKPLFGVSLAVQEWLRVHYFYEFEKLGRIDDGIVKTFLNEEDNADIKFGKQAMQRKFDEFKHSSAYIAVRIRSLANSSTNIDDSLKSALELKPAQLLDYLVSKDYRVTKRIIPSLEEIKSDAETADKYVKQEDLPARFFFKEAGYVFQKLIEKDSPADEDIREFFLRALQTVDGLDVSESLKDKPEKKKILINALARAQRLIYYFEKESELVTVEDKVGYKV